MSLEGLVLAALEAQEVLGAWRDSPEAGTKHEVAALLVQLLRHKAGMLAECFGIEVTEGELLNGPSNIAEGANRAAGQTRHGVSGAPNCGYVGSHCSALACFPCADGCLASLPQLVDQHAPELGEDKIWLGCLWGIMVWSRTYVTLCR